MLKRLTARERLEALASIWEPILSLARNEAIEGIKSALVFKCIVKRL
jgi:hypothetical protein